MSVNQTDILNMDIFSYNHIKYSIKMCRKDIHVHLPNAAGMYSSVSSCWEDDEYSAAVTGAFATVLECLGGLTVTGLVVNFLPEHGLLFDHTVTLPERVLVPFDDKIATFSMNDLFI